MCFQSRMQFKKIWLVASLATLLSGCSPYLYIPDSVYMPLASDKGEFKANVCYGTSGTGLQASYCIGKHVLVMTNISEYNSVNNGTYTPGLLNFPYSYNNFCGDLGLGYFHRLGTHGRVELIAGAGYGSSTSNLEGAPPDHSAIGYSGNLDNYALNGNFMHFFAQPDIGLVYGNYEFGLGARFNELNLNGKYSIEQQTDSNKTFSHPVYNTNLNGTALVIQPAFTVSLGLEKLKLNLNLGYSALLSGPDIDPKYGSVYQSFFVSGGVTVNLFRKLQVQ